MSQNDFNIANASGAGVRSDINSAFQALASLSAGATEPNTIYPNQLWYDSTNSLLKIRNPANSAWVILGSLSGSIWRPYQTGSGSNHYPLIPKDTKMVFVQAAAPNGWTQDTSQNDKVFRVVSGAGGGTGGSWTISGVTVDNHTLTAAQSGVPAHTHTIYASNTAYGSTTDENVLRNSTGNSDKTSAPNAGANAGSGHNHNLTIGSSWRPAYQDALVATKD